MKEGIIVDSNIIIQYLKTGKGVLPTAYEKYTMYISAATFSELLASKTFVDDNLEKEVLDFVDKYLTIKEIDKKVAHEAARLLREYDITLATSYVAATCITEGMKLLTEDASSFSGISGVSLLSM